MIDLQPHAAVIDGKLYAYGATRYSARNGFIEQISGGTAVMKRRMLDRVTYIPLTDDEASEVAECVTATAIEWL